MTTSTSRGLPFADHRDDGSGAGAALDDLIPLTGRTPVMASPLILGQHVSRLGRPWWQDRWDPGSLHHQVQISEFAPLWELISTLEMPR